jgi:hypothetical protein
MDTTSPPTVDPVMSAGPLALDGVDLQVTDKRGRQRRWPVAGEWPATTSAADPPSTSTASHLTSATAEVIAVDAATQDIHQIAIHMGSTVRKPEARQLAAVEQEEAAAEGTDAAAGADDAQTTEQMQDRSAQASADTDTAAHQSDLTAPKSALSDPVAGDGNTAL